jgi:anaerobic magnesium-protoporphyrin IX monomethyl ester cyclase
MRFALVNPNWTFGGSIYFGCHAPHLPLEFGYAQALLRRAGHGAEIIDGHLLELSPEQIREAVSAFAPDYIVITTAPSYLFWRCPPPELRVPLDLLPFLKGLNAILLAVGPHPSTTPGAALNKLGVDAVIMGEFEEILPHFAEPNWRRIPSLCYYSDGQVRIQGKPHVADLAALPPLVWPEAWLERHRHHHHRFEAPPEGPGAEIESSRGCPYHCSFCAKESFRGPFRKRPLNVVLAELDRLLDQGVEYVYFIDEIFLPDEALLRALAERPVKFGMQTRIDLWSRELLPLLGLAGCVSIEAGVESLTPQGRDDLNKPCRMTTEQLTEQLIEVRRYVPFVQANLVRTSAEDIAQIHAWRAQLRRHGVWANDPIPLYCFPGSPAYRQRWGHPDDLAWERSHADYLSCHPLLSNLQEERPLSLHTLERQGRQS